MKYIMVIILFGSFAQAQWGGVVSGTSHKTDNGKYPFYFDDQGHPEVWSDTMQKDYDEKMSGTMKQLCSDQTSLGEFEKEYIEADKNDGDKLVSHPELGKKIDDLKADIAKLSNVVIKGTGQNAKIWGCQ